MPSIRSITLRNFKGIEELSIDLDDRVDCPVTTLVGLNESGKTTILEGLSHFISGDTTVSSLFQGIHSKSTGAGLIPVHKKAAFTADVEIEATVQLDQADTDKLQKLADKFRVTINKVVLLEPFTVSKTFQFQDSELKNTNNFWNFDLFVTSKNGKQEKQYVRPKQTDENQNRLMRISPIYGWKSQIP
jgi:predicted ATP-dependent endonuclease of OLD family